MGKKLIVRGADFSENGISPDYQKLAWVGNGDTNTSYFRLTGLTSDCKIIITFDFFKAKVYNTPSSANIFGAVIANKYLTALQTTSDVYGYFVTSSNTARVANTNIGDGTTATVELSKLGIKVNTKTIVAPTTPIETKFDIPYFGLDAAASATGTAVTRSASNADPAMRIRSVKIYSDVSDDTSLIVDAIPVKRKEDGVVCLYNKVDGTYIERVDGTQPAYGELE